MLENIVRNVELPLYRKIKTAFVCVGTRFKYRSDNGIFEIYFFLTATTVDCFLQTELSGQLSPDLTGISF